MATQKFHAEMTIVEDGKLTIDELPFRRGDRVEIFLRGRSSPEEQSGERYPLRDKPVRYRAPYDSIAEDEWEALD